MPVFYFDTDINGQVNYDDEGIVLPDLNTARREATVALYGLAGEVEPDADEVEAVLRVRDNANHVVLALNMRLTISATAAHAGAGHRSVDPAGTVAHKVEVNEKNVDHSPGGTA